jgi:hypothetical protein
VKKYEARVRELHIRRSRYVSRGSGAHQTAAEHAKLSLTNNAHADDEVVARSRIARRQSSVRKALIAQQGDVHAARGRGAANKHDEDQRSDAIADRGRRVQTRQDMNSQAGILTQTGQW